MEYVNINSVVDADNVPEAEKKELLDRYSEEISTDKVMTTSKLELLRGQEIIDVARAQGDKIVPLRRVELIKETENFPKRVLLELTTACNSDCTMCPRNVLTRTIQHMDTELAMRTIDSLASVGISGLWLYNIGESLLHPKFYEILEYCRQYDNLGPLWLSTNGEILDDARIELLLDYPVDILNYSVNAMSEETFKKVSPALNFDHVQKNIHTLIRRKREKGVNYPLIRTQMIEMPSVSGEIEMFLEEFGDKADILSINQLEIFSQNVPANVENQEESKNKVIDVCNRLDREDFFIFADGSVSCCDTDFNCTLNIGNVRENTVQDIFLGPQYQNMKSLYKEGRLHEVDLCAKCRDFDL
ncbi:MAG: radical SAM protein [Rhodospirillales bacterium]|nr:radical SAM protein [Rhodospirillales bacterium]